MRLRVVASVALALVLPTAGATLCAVPASASRLQAPPNFDEYDQAKVDELMTQGFSEGEALFIALTKVEGKAIGDDRVRITNTFPTGNQAVINIRVVPDNGANPDTPEVKSGTSGGDFEFSLKYFVSYDAIPPEAQPATALGDGSAGPVASVASFGEAAPAGDDPHGVQVIVKGLVKKFAGGKVSDFVKFLDDKLGTGAKGDRIFKGIKAGLSIRDAMALSSEFDALKAELDSLEKCAKNPTDPLTKRAYKEDSGEQDRILKEIAAVRAEIKANTAVAFIGTLNKEAAGLVKGAPWLGYVVGPGTSWALENLKRASQAAMNEIRKRVTSCELDLKIDGVIGTPAANVTGVKCDGPVGAWHLEYTQPAANSEGNITFTLPKDTLSGPYSAAGHSGSRGTSYGGTATYAGAPDGTSGTLTLSVLGSVPVTGGKFCKNGEPPGG